MPDKNPDTQKEKERKELENVKKRLTNVERRLTFIEIQHKLLTGKN